MPWPIADVASGLAEECTSESSMDGQGRSLNKIDPAGDSGPSKGQ